MFKISVQTAGPQNTLGVDGAYRAIKEAGFDAVDANVDALYSYSDIVNCRPSAIFSASDKETVEHFLPWGTAAKKYGLENYQAHSPFPTIVSGEKEQSDFLMEVLRKTIIGCDVIDCRKLIVHPFFATSYDKQFTPEEEWEINIEKYTKLIPTAKQYGVTICLENMFTSFKGRIYAACCSNIETACRYVDTLNEIAGERIFSFCLDTGHLVLVGLDVKNAMIQLGDRIDAFHVHDNNGINDQHIAPYHGVADWERFIEGLKAIKFNKTLSFETVNAWRNVPAELGPDMLRYIANAGRMFARRAGE